MIISNKPKFSYDDVAIIPAEISTISSRSECNPFNSNGKLPIFTAAMNTVVDENNYEIFEKNNINVILPRTVSLEIRQQHWNERFVAISLVEAEELFLNESYMGEQCFICIDIANGHMTKLIDTIGLIKNKYGDNVIIMSGNIANPETYKHFNAVGCDFCKLGVGGGCACTSSSNTSIHYAYASLIIETYEIKKQINGKTKILADGNCRGYRDAIKALGLGADGILIGSLFAKAWESSGETFIDGVPFELWKGNVVEDTLYRDGNTAVYKYLDLDVKKKIATFVFEDGGNEYNVKYDNLKIQKLYRGMSTKEAQKAMGNKVLKTSEGTTKMLDVDYTLGTWVENMIDYLKSAMSYTNSRTLEEFIGEVDMILLTDSASKRFND